MEVSPVFPLKVFFDGGCGICSSEMRTYRSREHGGRLIFIDIRDPRFVPGPYGIPLDEFTSQLHAIDSSGRVFKGVEAFRAIWRAFPGSRRYLFIDRLMAFAPVNFVSKLLYRGIARIRGHIPRM